MIDYIYIGKIVNTHGIKGEIRLLSDFEHKEKIFKHDFNIYIGTAKIKETINTYRPHKNFDMITLVGYDNINQVLKYMKEKVYILKSDLILNDNEFLDKDLTNLEVIINNEVKGKVVRLERYPKNNLLVINYNQKEYLIPYNNDIIEKIDFKKQIIYIKDVKGLIE